LSDLNETLISRQMFEKSSNIKFHEIRPMGAELFDVNGQTKLIVASYNFANMPKNHYVVVLKVIVYSITAQETYQ